MAAPREHDPPEAERNDSIGPVLKEARRRLGLRVKDVAARTSAGISPSYLSCIENDLRLPSEDLLLELAGILDLDKRALYMQLVRLRAPGFLRDEIGTAGAAPDPRYLEARSLPLSDILERAHEATGARRELERLRRDIARLERDARARRQESFASRWSADLERYRMQIEKTVVEGALSVAGDLVLERHVIGLEPRPGKPPIVVIQHTARTPYPTGTAGDDGFKLLEHPPDVAVEVERERLDQGTLLRIVFPDGLAHQPGRDRRVSYRFRSVFPGVYRMEDPGPPSAAGSRTDALRDDRGARGTFVVLVDKPCQDLDLEVRFPRHYVPHGVEAWAGTQEFHEAEDNIIDRDVCERWHLTHAPGDRVRLEVRRPLVGVKFGVVWRPLFREEFERVRQRLELDEEEAGS